MSKRLLTRLGLLWSVAVMLIHSCSTGPVTGTETGNPDISACLNSALSIFDSTDRWLPSTYLDGGERQLSPDNIYAAPALQHIAKRKASDSAATVPDDTTAAFDTVIVIDTVIRRDTVVLDTVVQDTVQSTIDGTPEANVLVFERIRYDSIFIIDTQVVRDTFLVSVPPTTGGPASDGARGSFELDLTSRSDSAETQYVVVRGSSFDYVLHDTTVPATTARDDMKPLLVVRSDSSIVMVARKVTIGGIAVSEVYSDADGNGTLDDADNGTAALLTCTGFYSGASIDVDLVVDFDAGIDANFSTTGDNRIYSLQRKTAAPGRTEQVRYGARYFGQTGDTVVLLRETGAAIDSVEHTEIRYLCRTGTDPLDHRMNSLIYCQQTIGYRTGSIRRMELTVTPVAALAAGTKPVAGTMTAMIDFGKGLTGWIDAVVDYSAETVHGTFAQSGTEYSLDYCRKDRTLTLLPLP